MCSPHLKGIAIWKPFTAIMQGILGRDAVSSIRRLHLWSFVLEESVVAQ